MFPLVERLARDLRAAGIHEINDAEEAIEAQCTTPEAIQTREWIVACRGDKYLHLSNRMNPNPPVLYGLDPVQYNQSYLDS